MGIAEELLTELAGSGLRMFLVIGIYDVMAWEMAGCNWLWTVHRLRLLQFGGLLCVTQNLWRFVGSLSLPLKHRSFAFL